MKWFLKGAAAVFVGCTLASVGLAQTRHEGHATDDRFSFCDWIDQGMVGRPDLDQIQDAFNATGYIAAQVCHPHPKETWTDESKELAGNYTRWVVEPADEVAYNNGQRVYSAEGRRWYQRLFTDRVIDTAHFLEISMSAPDVSFTIPLATFKYNEEGENGIEYTTSFRQHAYNQTYFRVDSNTTSNVVARGRHSRKTSFSGIAETLGAVQSVIQLVSPSVTLLTSENANKVTEASTAINTVASSLFSNAYDETIEDGFSLSDWHEKRRMLVVVQFPYEVTSHKRNPRNQSTRERRKNKNNPAVYKAFWLSLACPRRSIFNPADLCDKGQYFSATTRSVLNFQMAENKTVQQFLDDQQWYKDFLISPILKEGLPPLESKGAKVKRAARDAQIKSFLRSIENAFYNAGFNSGDVELIVEAAIDGMPELASVSRELRAVYKDDGDFRGEGVLFSPREVPPPPPVNPAPAPAASLVPQAGSAQ